MADPQVPQSLAEYLERVVGECLKVTSLSVPGDAEVLEAQDAEGVRWFAKRVPHDGQWRSEVRAYRHWVPALQERAPRLRAADGRSRSLVMSAVPGCQGDPFDPSLHHAAGEVLSRFHESRPPRQTPAQFPDRVVQRLEKWLVRADGMFTAAEVDFARSQTRELASMSPPTQVPCHGDYKPHNWLVDEKGVVRVIDFAESRWNVRPFDLSRLHYGPWWGRPHLAEAFLAGYGRQLGDQDRTFIRLSGASNAVVTAIWCRLNGQPDVEAQARERLAALMTGRFVKGSRRRWRRRA